MIAQIASLAKNPQAVGISLPTTFPNTFRICYGFSSSPMSERVLPMFFWMIEVEGGESIDVREGNRLDGVGWRGEGLFEELSVEGSH